MSFRITLSEFSNLAKYSMTQSARGLSATAELLVLLDVTVSDNCIHAHAAQRCLEPPATRGYVLRKLSASRLLSLSSLTNEDSSP